jgi:sugar lactone lactonase YvrE
LTTKPTSAQSCAIDGISKTYAGTRTAATQITPDVPLVTQRRAKMIIREIKPDWFRLDADGLVFFGYTQDHVRHKFMAWVREHDLKGLR